MSRYDHKIETSLEGIECWIKLNSGSFYLPLVVSYHPCVLIAFYPLAHWSNDSHAAEPEVTFDLP